MPTMIEKRCAALGLKKYDSTSPLVLEVRSADVKEASKKNPTCCAFAIAAKRSMPAIKAAYFFRSVAWLEYGDCVVRYALPENVQRQIADFDRTKTMTTGVYELAPQPPSQSLGGYKGANAKRPNRASGSRKSRKKRRQVKGRVRPPVASSSTVRARFEPTVPQAK